MKCFPSNPLNALSHLILYLFSTNSNTITLYGSESTISTLAQQSNLRRYFMTDVNNLGRNSGGWIDGVLESMPKSSIECVLAESLADSLLQLELNLFLLAKFFY